jgi:hypothetical protein
MKNKSCCGGGMKSKMKKMGDNNLAYQKLQSNTSKKSTVIDRPKEQKVNWVK